MCHVEEPYTSTCKRPYPVTLAGKYFTEAITHSDNTSYIQIRGPCLGTGLYFPSPKPVKGLQ